MEQEIMDNIKGLPEDPMKNIGGARFLRFSNKPPERGYIILFKGKPTIVRNDNFGKVKEEYQWAVTIWIPPSSMSEDRILVESGKNFCTALQKASGGEYIGKSFLVQWRKEEISKGRELRNFSISPLDKKDIKELFRGVDVGAPTV